MAFSRKNEVQTHLKATADTRGLSEMAMAQRRALQQMQAQQSAFSRASLGQLQRVDKATRNVMRRTGTGAAASLSQGLNAGGKQLHQAGNNLVSIAQKHAVRMGGVFQQLGFQASLVGTSMTQAFTAPVAAVIGLSTVLGVKLAAKLESAKTALGALLPAGYNVEALLNRLRKAAIKSPVFDTVQLVDFTRKLVASGIEAKKGELIIDSLGKVFQTFGVSGEGASLALRGITQAFSKGKLQAEELTGQIGEQIPALRLLARAAGVSQGEFLKMVREGKITSAVFQDLLIKIGKFPEINRGATASLNTMQGAWDRLKESVFDALALTWLRYTPQIQASLKQLEKQIPNAFKAFGPLVPRLVNGFAAITKGAIALLEWYNNLDVGTRKLVNILGLLLVTAGPLIIFFGKLATGAGAAFVVLRTLLTPVGALTLALTALTGVGVVAWMNSLGKEGGLLHGIMDRLSAGWDSAGKKAVGLAGHLRTVTTDFDNLKTRVSGSLRTLNTDFSDTASKATGLSGTFRSLGRDFTTLGATYAPKLSGSLRTLNTDFGDNESKATGLSGTFRSLGRDFSDTASKITGLSGTFRSVERDFGNTEKSAVNLSGSFRGLGRDFGNLGKVSSETQDPVKKFGADLRKLKDSIVDNLLPAIGDFGKKLGGELQPALENVNDIIGGKGGGLLDTLKKFTDDLSNWINTNGDKIAEGVGSWAEDLTDGMKKALEEGDWKSLGSAAGEALGEIFSGVGDITEEMKKLFEKVDWVEVGKEVGKNAFGFVTGFMAGLGDDISSGDFWKNHWEDAAIAGVSFIGVGKVGAAVGKVLGKAIPKGFKGAKKVFQKGWEGVTKGFNALKGTNFVKLLGPMKNILIPFRALWDNLGKKAIEGGKNVVSIVRTGFQRIGNVGRTVWDNISGRFNFENIKNGFRNGFAALRGLVQSGMETIALKFLYAKDRVMNVLHRVLLDPLLGVGRSLKSIFLTFISRFAFLTWLVEVGKDVVQGFINGIVEFAKDIWKKFKEHVIDPIVNGIKGFLGIHSPSTFFYDIGKNIVQGLKDGISAAVSGLGSLFTNAWDAIRTTAIEKWNNIKSAIVGIWDSVKNVATEKWNAVKNALGAAWDSVKKWASEKWNAVKDTVVGALNKVQEKVGISSTWVKDTLSNAWKAITSGVRKAWDTVFNVIKSRWDAVRNVISTVWNRYIWPIFKTVMKIITQNVPNAFASGVSLIGKFFSSLGNVLKAPVNWVISYVINRGIVSPLNFIKDKLGIGGKNIPWVTTIGGSPPRPAPVQRSGLTAGRAKGGRLRGGIPGKDSIPVMAMHDEYVIKTKSARKLGFDRLEYMNRTGELPGYAKGGRVHSRRTKVTDRPSASKRSGGPFDAITDAIMDPIGWLTKKAGIDRVFSQFRNIKGSEWGNIVGRLPKKALDMALEKITSWLGSFGDDGGGVYLGRDPTNSIQTILSVARRFYRGARVSSGYRPGERTYHGRGLAADLIGGGASGMATIARGFMGMSGRLLELIHSGGGGFFVKHGKRVGAGYYRSEIPAHFNHVHVAARKDALLARLGGAMGTGGGNLGAWVRQAMGITNTSGSWYSALVALAKHESGGNPRAQNNWDSNARRGTPSKGLFQTIDPTFNRWSLPGMKNIWNPVHNAVAAIRYIKNRYGSIFQIPSYRPGPRFVGGYEFGTPFVPKTGMAFVHKGERIIPAAQNRGYPMQRHGRGGASGDVHVHFEGPVMGHRDLEDALTGIVDQLRRKGRLPKR